MTMQQKPYLNLGCGRIILPAPRPVHHGLVDEGIYAYPLWLNVDRNAEPGVDQVMDLFAYPWNLPDNSFDGALLSHIVEHIPHEIRYSRYPEHDWLFGHGSDFPRVHSWLDRWFDAVSAEKKLQSQYQDGWYAFFAELYRVLTPGAVVHILSPYGWSQGGITDPTHTRLLTEHTFSHSMKPDPDSPFKYATGGVHFEIAAAPLFGITEMFEHLRDKPERLRHALQTQINVAYDLYVKLEVVK